MKGKTWKQLRYLQSIKWLSRVKIRDQYHLKPGQKVVFIPFKNSLRMVIVPPIEEGYGFLQGIDTSINRDEEDRP